MLDFLTFEVAGYSFLLILLCAYLFKDFKKNKNKSVENENKKADIVEKKREIPEPVKKMLELIKILPKREDEPHNNHSAKIIAEKLNKNFKLENDVEDTIHIDDDLFEYISDDLDSRLGSTLAPLVRRVEKDGSIVLDMEAIRFITGEHIPLVTPTGAIRVMNFLTIEQDLEICIMTGKPFFYRSSKTNTLEKLSVEQINKLILSDELVNYSEVISEKNDCIKSLSDDNNKQFDLIEEQKNKIIFLDKENEKLKNQLELLIQISSSNPKDEVLTKAIKNEEKDTVQIKEISVNENISIEEKKEIEPHEIVEEDIKHKSEEIVSIINEQPLENAQENPIVKISKETTMEENKKEEIKRVETVLENKDNNSEKKLNIITDSSSKKVFELLFSSNRILSSKYISNANIKYDKLVYISNNFNEYTKEYTLNFIEKNLLLELKNIAKEEGYLFIENSFETLMGKRKYERLVAYFTDQNERKMYSTNLIKISFKEDELLGLMLSNKRYSDIFTKNEILSLLENEQRDVYKKMYKRRLNDINNGDYNVF